MRYVSQKSNNVGIMSSIDKAQLRSDPVSVTQIPEDVLYVVFRRSNLNRFFD